MPNVFDTAKYILDELGPTTTMKLQKLCFFAQTGSLIWDGEQLFPEEFEAWANGPVCRELYDWHQDLYYKVSADDVPTDKLSGEPLSAEAIETIASVLDSYGDKTGHWLGEIVRTDDPWLNARKERERGEPCDEIISKTSMAEFYEQFVV